MSPTPPKSLNSQVVYGSRTIQVIEEQIELSTGLQKTFVRVEHPGAVVILPITNDGNLLILHQYRHALKQYLYEFPAGTLNPKEDPLLCAQRELSEEAGVEAEMWQELGILYPAPGFCDEKQYLYSAKGLSPKSLPGDDDEVIEVCEISLSKAIAMVQSGEICDAKSIAILARAGMLRG